MSAAAEKLGLTTPAVHSQLRGLERALGCRLFAKGGAATAEGQAVLMAARQIENSLSACIARVASLRHGQAGSVVLGVVSTAKYVAPQLVAEMGRALPDLDIILRVGNRDAIVSALEDRSIELAIMGRPPRRPQVVATVLAPHPHVLIAPPGHPLATGAEVSAEALLEETFIAREQGSGTRILMTRFLDRIGEGTPYRLIEMGSNETIKQAVIAGLGVALISQHTVTEELNAHRLALIDAAGLPIQRHWYLIHRADEALTPPAEAVRDFISRRIGEVLPVLNPT